MPRAISILIALCAAQLAVPAPAQERSVDKEVLINADIERVWRSWTTREGITAFFAPDAEIDARVGGAFHIYMDPRGEPGMKGADDMRIMALQPPKMLSFDWNAPPSLPQARGQRTFVVVRLAPVDATHTRVTIHHTGWGEGGEWDKAYVYFDKAWTQVLANLKQRFETGPRDWSDWLKQMDERRPTPAR